MTILKNASAAQNLMNRYEPPQAGNPYSLDDLTRGKTWLGHRSFTELNAISDNPEKPAKIAYAPSGNSEIVIDFVRRNHRNRKLFWGINERPGVLENERGYARSARNMDIEYISNILIDIDLKSRNISDAQRYALMCHALNEVGDYFEGFGFVRPTYTDTGQGGHIKAALPPVATTDHPDITERIKQFVLHEFGKDFKCEHDDLEAHIDNTFDARRMARMEGTSKPSVGYVSVFHGGERHEDQELRTHLLGMKLPEQKQSYEPSYGVTLITVQDNAFHPIVESLLKRDDRLNDLAHLKGKPEGTDQSRSGYHYSFARRLLALGVRDIDIIGSSIAVLARLHDKPFSEEYARRTLAAVLVGKY